MKNPNLKPTVIIMLIALAWTLAGCCIEGSGDIEKETRSISDFNKLHIDAPANVYITQGDTHKVTVKIDDNLMDRVKTKVRSNTLYIDLSPNTCIDSTTFRIDVRMPKIKELNIDGSADVLFKDRFEGKSLIIDVDGSGDVETAEVLQFDMMDIIIDGSSDMKLNLDTADLLTQVDGSGDIAYDGFAAHHSIDIDGSADIIAYNLETDDTDIIVDGSGNCKVSANETLDVDINGSASIYYHGDPDVQKHIDGSGKVKQTD